MRKLLLVIMTTCTVNMMAIDGALSGKFTINDSNVQVCFSKGNLQYQASTDTWKFADHQYDIIGAGNNNIASNYSGWIDLFGWGTSGFNEKYPYMISNVSTDYGDDKHNLTATNYDWGVYNLISNGGNETGMWRTLTLSEWEYILYFRNNAASLRFPATVEGQAGFVLLPDDRPSGGWGSYSKGKKWTANIISANEWTIWEDNGAVFLPCAGTRRENTWYGGEECYYWTATSGISNKVAYEFSRDRSTLEKDYENTYVEFSQMNRYVGLSVRLVRLYDYNESTDFVFQNVSNISTKFLRDGQILILRGNHAYTLTGQKVR